MPTAVRRYVRSLGLDAYVVGGAVRDELLGHEHADEDFVVPGVDHAGLRRLLEPHGRVEDMEVHGQLVGVRLHPGDRGIRTLVPAGIEITPPRAERSTGPRHKDFEIVADSSITLEEDMGRRDFTVNAIARRLADGEIVDPFGGLGDLARRELRTVSARSFAEDPLRLLRALRLVSTLGFSLTGETRAQMALEAEGLEHVSAERIGGGLAADGMGELSQLLLGRHPARALVLARETGVFMVLLPELAPTVGYRARPSRHAGTLDDHLIGAVEAAAGCGASLQVRLAALFHDAGRPMTDDSGDDHPARSAEIADHALRRLRYPTAVRRDVARLVRAHGFRLDGVVDERAARHFLAEHGDAGARELLALKAADLAAKHAPPEEVDALARLAALVEAESGSPHRLSDLAVDGDDLVELGFRPGPELGRVLHVLLEAVVDDPSANTREALLERARRELA